MPCPLFRRLAVIILSAMLAACGGDYGGGATSDSARTGTDAGGGRGDGGDIGNSTSPEQFFAEHVQASLGFCRSCHVPGGVADTDAGRRFMLSSQLAEDFDRLRASWLALGKGVESNRILTKASNTDSEPHSAGAPWPKGSVPYDNMKTLLACWDAPSSCSLAGGGGVSQLPPLLGDLQANGGRNYAAVHCEVKADGEPLPQDPRELITGELLNNPNYAVWYNDPFEICETDVLFENQRKQNELLVAQGKKPVYSAKPRPRTCGEWRTAVENGRQYIMHNPITGQVLTRDSLYNLVRAAQVGFSAWGGAGEFPSDPAAANELIRKIAQQRYGWPSHPYDNPFPMPGEDPNTSNGGSLQLPIALVQMKNDDGRWNGNIGVTCYACHIGQIGNGEVVGNSAKRDGHPELYGGSPEGSFVSLNGSNTDTGLAMYDVNMANGTFGFGPDDFGTPLNTPGYMAARTRGSNAADQEIVNVLLGRDLDTLNWRGELPMAPLLLRLVPSAPFAGGDQDMPTWWWTHNKTRYLWVGFGSAGSSRGNFFPSSTNPNDGHWSKAREGDYQDLDTWLNAIEAPPFVGPPINAALAEAGAILFHKKDLWADDGNNDIPRPPHGNGSCASCHGAYSPRFIHEPGYLPDPRLAGMSGATVPLAIIRTDAAQSDLFTLGGSYRDAYGEYGGPTPPLAGRGIGGGLGSSWFAYPDAVEGYRFPELKTPFEEAVDDLQGAQGTCPLGTHSGNGGYTAQPLHGVWATAPYFHNGSVPTVWDVLKPSDRPKVWLRQRVPESEAAPHTGDRGFDTNLTRAYDYEKLGWKYERLECGVRNTLNSMNCQVEEATPAPMRLFLTPFKVIADYFSPPYTTDPKQDSVADRAIYDTHIYSKGNQGHEFTKVLTDEERRALIEYLKTL